MSSVKHAVIAVAGLGSRLGHGKPKCLVEVEGKHILEWQLELLKDVEDVRLVVGYMEHDVIDMAFSIRRDLTLVRNPAYRTTTTQQSYWLGARYLEDPCLYMDGDIIFEPKSFNSFLDGASQHAPLIGITPAKTQQAVFAKTTVGENASDISIQGFSRTDRTEWEWANIAYLPPHMLQENGRDVFSRLALYLPLKAQSIECCEVDTEEDLSLAVAFASSMT